MLEKKSYDASHCKSFDLCLDFQFTLLGIHLGIDLIL